MLARCFPREQEQLRAQAEEAAMSRLSGGIHYRFDSEVGLRMGRAIAALAVGSPLASGLGPFHGIGMPDATFAR